MHPSPVRRAVRRVDDLVAAGLLEPSAAAELEPVTRQLSLAITPEMLAAIDPDDPDDPIRRQFVPAAAELEVDPAERHDPIGDDRFTPLAGITHRHPDRALLKPVHVCPVYCRFCFRREKVGPGGAALSRTELRAALDYVRAHPEIWEVILTGGEPLVLSPRRLRGIVRALDAIAHVGTIRVHTRVPVVDPGRVTAELVEALRAATPVWVVVHANHPRELGPAAREALARLADGGVPLLAQTVLLRGVNDDADTLAELLRALVRLRVKPYYLHQGDLARGTGHLRTTIAEGQALVRELRRRVSGTCLPTYVLDIPGGHGKVPVGPSYLEAAEDGWFVEDVAGCVHRYPPGPEPASDPRSQQGESRIVRAT